MEKLKERLDMFSDAVIAIIITIMVLELPMPQHDSVSEYLQFGKAIGIFFISFCYVANIWYQHSILYSDAETINNKVFISEFIFLAFLSLIPTFTKLITVDTNRHTVLSYGILTFIVNGLFMLTSYAVVHQKYSDKSDTQKIFQKIYLNHSNFLGMINVIVLILAYFKPNWAVWCYLALPVISFVFNRDDQVDLQEVTKLPQADQDKYLNLSNTDMRGFRKRQHQIGQKYMKQRQTNPNWQDDMGKEMRDLFKDGRFDRSAVRGGYSGRPHRFEENNDQEKKDKPSK
ncbi:TMEM175 family protein [Pediococcus inopinatus]|uniref:TMEM175 family protein n=2 Tax=Pediococcus inopinatus TaxID=114090 RepID=A0ABZ0Q5L0_9LACO|nr:TMEM175 family protein [Pediococcus inopinatus]WPC18657.1 TMEM175 family protein [Pediococcus inopinatus]WPC22271.1 TMEM175 family protein [Pediococcus inopinatus]